MDLSVVLFFTCTLKTDNLSMLNTLVSPDSICIVFILEIFFSTSKVLLSSFFSAISL